MSQTWLEAIPPELLKALIDNPHESLILVDARGIVRFMSRSSHKFYQVSGDQALGRHIREVNPQTKLPRVIETGRAEIGRVLEMRGSERIIARIPLRNAQGEIVGAMAKLMFWEINRVRELTRQLEVAQGRLDYYEKELKNLYSSRYDPDLVVGQSPAIREAKQMAAQAAASDLAVLITGETGTGKELLAHVVHRLSGASQGPFVKVNCAAIPRELFESELFGYEKGAFTGADARGKPGKFELADGGAIFLDEVGEMPLNVQAKLLRVIQEQELERLGGTRTLKLDFRVIAATNRDLKALMEEGGFRQDLYYRLNIFHLQAPPLREIREDIPRIAYYILSELGMARKGTPSRITQAAMARLTSYHWPGNVRELKNALERAAAVAGSGPLDEEHLPPDLLGEVLVAADISHTPGPLRQEMARAEKAAIERALAHTGGNRAQAARLLDIHRTGLYQKIKRYGLE